MAGPWANGAAGRYADRFSVLRIKPYLSHWCWHSLWVLVPTLELAFCHLAECAHSWTQMIASSVASSRSQIFFFARWCRRCPCTGDSTPFVGAGACRSVRFESRTRVSQKKGEICFSYYPGSKSVIVSFK